MKKQILTVVVLLSLPFLNLHAAEIDQLTDRQDYQDSALDFTGKLNQHTNELIGKAVTNYNRTYAGQDLTPEMVQRYMAFEIYKSTAGGRDAKFSTTIPDRINVFYALGKSGRGPLQEWIEGDENSKWWTKLDDNNIYTEIIPEPLNKNYIIKVGGEFIGPDKIDHFFDQGYSYWLKSNFGKNDKKALEFGKESEYGWYGIKAVGVFSFADLRANWGGYQFYKHLFSGDTPVLKLRADGKISIAHPFDWKNYIDWQFDELKNPSMLSRQSMRKICRHIEENHEKYEKTYLFLEKEGFFKKLKKRDSYYTAADTNPDPSLYFNFQAIMTHS